MRILRATPAGVPAGVLIERPLTAGVPFAEGRGFTRKIGGTGAVRDPEASPTLTWPRPPDERATISDITNGTISSSSWTPFVFGDQEGTEPEVVVNGKRTRRRVPPGMVQVVGSFPAGAIQASDPPGKDAWDLLSGDVLPPVFYLQYTGVGAGKIQFRYWALEQEHANDVEKLSHLITAMGGASSVPQAYKSGVIFTQSISDGLLTAAAAGTQATNAKAGVRVRIVTDPGNSAPVFAAETQTKAALLGAAGGGIAINAAAELDYYGVLWLASASGAQKAYILRDS